MITKQLSNIKKQTNTASKRRMFWIVPVEMKTCTNHLIKGERKTLMSHNQSLDYGLIGRFMTNQMLVYSDQRLNIGEKCSRFKD